jgi:type I restriction enzyme S subunit
MLIKCPSGWRLANLTELGEVNRGRSRHRPRYAKHLYGGPYPFIQTGDVKASKGRITSYTQTYSEAGLAQSRLWPAGTMCITIAANIAETGILSFPACFPDSVVGFIANSEKADVRFVEYMFRFLRRQIQHQASGSVQDNINLETLERLRFPLPPLSEQKTIAAVLGSLDDKIELNRRMNATLEAMARALFQSWFVDFDPVRAKQQGRPLAGLDEPTAALFPDQLQPSELGEIPSGWLLTKIEDIAERVAMGPFGSSIKVSTFVPDGIPVISGQHLHGTMLDDTDFNFVSLEHADQLHRSNVQRGDVIFTHAGNIGQVAVVPESSQFTRYVISQRQFYMRCDASQITPLYVTLYFKTPLGQHRLLANTSVDR